MAPLPSVLVLRGAGPGITQFGKVSDMLHHGAYTLPFLLGHVQEPNLSRRTMHSRRKAVLYVVEHHMCNETDLKNAGEYLLRNRLFVVEDLGSAPAIRVRDVLVSRLHVHTCFG